jgi:hypothetical protein
MTRRIVEIKETGSNYFERAIFFVRMDMPQNTLEYTLTQEASKIIDKFCSDLKLTKSPKKSKLLEVVKILLAAAAGAAAAVLVLELSALT